MAGLHEITTPAERLSGCKLAELGGILTGSNNFEYVLSGREFYSDKISIICEFWPDFNLDVGINKFLYDTDTSTRYFAFIGTSGSLSIRIADNNIVIPSAEYSNYWLTNERNVLSIVSEYNVNTTIRLNNNIIKTSVLTASVKSPAKLFIGSYYTGSLNFTGKISYMKVFQRLLSEEENADIWNKKTYNYRNEASLDLPMTQRLHDPPTTYDISRNSANATLINSPTKASTKSGYIFNGSDQYATVPSTGLLNSSEVSLVCKFTPYGAYDEDRTYLIYDSDDTNRFYMVKLNNINNNNLSLSLGNTAMFTITPANYANFWKSYSENTMVITGKTSGENKVYLNNNLISSNSTAWTLKDPATFYISCRYSIELFFSGIVHSFQAYKRILTPVQIADISIRRSDDGL